MRADARHSFTFREILAAFLRGRGRDAMSAGFYYTLKQSATWLLPIFWGLGVGLAADAIQAQEAGEEVKGFLTTLLVLASVAFILTVQNAYTHPLFIARLSRICRGTGHDLRQRVCRQLQQLSLLYHGRTSVGRLQSKVVRDIDNIESGAMQMTEPFIAGVTMFAVVITVILIRAPLAIVVFLVMAPIGATLNAVFRHRLTQTAEEHRRSIERLSARLQDMITMIPLTRAHGLEDVELRTTEERIGRVAERASRFDRTVAHFASASWVSLVASQVIFFTAMVLLSTRYERVGVEEIVMFNSYYGQLHGAVWGILQVIPASSKVGDAFSSVHEILDAPDVELNRDKKPPDRIEGRIEFESVGYTYPGAAEPAVTDVSFTVEPGEAVAFVGPSGGGKSTTLSLAIGLLRPDSGRILLDGEDMTDLDMRAYRRRVAVVTQQSVFFSGSIRQNVAYGADDVSDEQFRHALELADAAEFVDRLDDGLDTLIGESGVKLSGGQSQRLALARALLRDPRVLVLDEPTSALDVESEIRFRDAMRNVMPGRTVLIVSHALANVRDLSRIYVIESGRLHAAGSHDELVTADNFYARAMQRLTA